MGQKRQQMLYLEGDLIDWYRKKYTEKSLSSAINELLKNFLYIQIDENNETIDQEISKNEKKLLEYEQKLKLLKLKKEEIEQNAIKQQENLKKLAEEREEAKIKCLICGSITNEVNKVELKKDKLVHKNCFNSSSASQINDLIEKINRGEI